MNKFELWFITKLFNKLFKQGPDHMKNFIMIYSLIRKACEKEFMEDNIFTTDCFLRDCFESTQKHYQVTQDDLNHLLVEKAHLSQLEEDMRKRISNELSSLDLKILDRLDMIINNHKKERK